MLIWNGYLLMHPMCVLISMLQASKPKLFQNSMGDNSSKTHLTVDSNGNPIQFLIHDGTSHNMKVATALVNPIDLKDTDVLCINKGYKSNLFIEKT